MADVLLSGNLLTLTQQEFQTSDWAASGTNTTIAYSSSFGYDGTDSLSMKSAAAGDVLLSINTFVPVTAGKVYYWSFWVYSPVATTCNSEVDWYNGSTYSTYNSTASNPPSLPASQWTKIIIQAACPSGCNNASPFPIPHATAANQTFYVDQGYFGSPPVPLPLITPYGYH